MIYDFGLIDCSDCDNNTVSARLVLKWGSRNEVQFSFYFIQTLAAKCANHLRAGKIKYSERMHVKQ